ncbi:hypothetical protein [Aeoliella mucimassa]|uniref:MoxR-vWA-beta-propeller ternary system domain-containing protein n=1 Tax=Aeoliella mucimassa TaxID=2527972 RepID=A0A518AUE5_9BACT|nr:hypothetical protein [Aeoliella mucimassa]QDU58346.1 hypothetical protein Pan181_45800 [Aeoliella mucimassa]
MASIELTIRPRATAPLATEAWYLPGHDVGAWLAEIAAWPVEHLAIRLILIRAMEEDRIAGVVAIPPRANFVPSGWCVPLGRLAPQLYLPIDAELFPLVSRKELADLCNGDYVYVWIPGCGLTAAEPEEIVSIDELVAAPSDDGLRWSQAVEGIAFPYRLSGIFPRETPTLEEMLDQGRDDIGEQAGDLTKLPKAPNEPLSGMAGAAMRAAMLGAAIPVLGVGKMLSSLGNMLSAGGSRQAGGRAGGAGGRSPFEGLGKFANDLMGRVSKTLEAQRNKEIGRLLHMLENDPDQGLKYALPLGLGSGNAHRGRAPAGGSLGARNVDFSLGGLRGGGPADFWDMSAEHRAQLLQKYRELAARESRLGRYRRAAYIYAELLGDLRSAASSLEQGRHFREAAVLYRERLHDAAAAATCLERGELWYEAIEAYRELGDHEKVGDLFRFIEQHEEADEAYHLAADQALAQKNLLLAARIYDEKLRDPRLAVQTLDSGWPEASQARQCVVASFSLRGRVGWHEEAIERANYLKETSAESYRLADVAELLAQVFETYPEAAVQEHSRKCSSQLVVARMRNAVPAEARKLVDVLARLAPEDRLITRDGLRFLHRDPAPVTPTPIATRRPPDGRLELVKQFDLGLPAVWKSAVALDRQYVVAGRTNNRAVFARFDVEGIVEKTQEVWKRSLFPEWSTLWLLGTQSPLQFHALGEERLPVTTLFEATSDMPSQVRAGTPRGLGNVLGTALGKTGHTWAIENRDDPSLICVDVTGHVIHTQSVLSMGNVPWSEVSLPVPMHVAGDHVVMAVGKQLFSLQQGHGELLHVLPEPVQTLSGGAPYAAPMMVATTESNVYLTRLGMDGYLRPVCYDMNNPKALLSLGGFLIAADASKIEMHELKGLKSRDRRHRKTLETNNPIGTPIAILPGEQTDQFVLVSATGKIALYRVDV